MSRGRAVAKKWRLQQLVGIGAVLLLPLGLAACSSSNEALVAAADTGFVAGDGSSISIPASERSAPVEFSGTDENGNTITNAEFLGNITVVNFWYAGCAPCRAEAADLNEAYAQWHGEGVRFLGVNTRDQAAQAKQFAAEFDVPYASIMDVADGRAVQSAFAGAIPLNAVPTTLVLDREGRVAHRILGQIAGASQLSTMIKETAAETAGS
ncbi:TlpA family protein disulfide reductase [Canibacter zhoujuaniae]|uniref:TlpA family protein disulfide reductase n=1 Tax=Canibacter zhoujuaniae TaxID=2708343 RepID=UPI0014231177|nr:TlpA disulfide reductase family protein [Canibacter zhoujuaniae]